MGHRRPVGTVIDAVTPYYESQAGNCTSKLQEEFALHAHVVLARLVPADAFSIPKLSALSLVSVGRCSPRRVEISNDCKRKKLELISLERVW